MSLGGETKDPQGTSMFRLREPEFAQPRSERGREMYRYGHGRPTTHELQVGKSAVTHGGHVGIHEVGARVKRKKTRRPTRVADNDCRHNKGLASTSLAKYARPGYLRVDPLLLANAPPFYRPC